VIYSVYRHTQRVFDYYEAPGPSGTHATAPPAPLASGKLGAPPEAATWRLPIGARKIGSGPYARGRIASMGGVALGEIATGDLAVVGIAVGVGYLLWRSLR
jgi:hypothetical protein